MRPLREGEPRYPVEADAIELVRSADCFEPAPGQKQRVTARLLAEGAPRRVRWLGAPLVVALCLCAAGASAAAGGRWVGGGYRALTQALFSSPKAAALPARSVSAARAKPKAVEAQPPSVEPAPARVEAEALVEAQARVEAEPRVEAQARVEAEPRVEAQPRVGAQPVSERRPVVEAAPRTQRTATNASSPARAHSATATDASNLVVGAMHSLRQQKRPEQAAKQLDEYMRRYPSGALAEEALALSVEAAVQRGDARARDLAERYLAKYPSGRFRSAAERARALFSK
ncbi:MAG: hypothetical protein QM756_03440 [Polyangiaceae bacterium]